MLQIRNAKYDPRDAITIVDLLEIGSMLDKMKKFNETFKDPTVLSTCIQRARKMQEDNPSEIKKEDLVAKQDIIFLRCEMEDLMEDIIAKHRKAFPDGRKSGILYSESGLQKMIAPSHIISSPHITEENIAHATVLK